MLPTKKSIAVTREKSTLNLVVDGLLLAKPEVVGDASQGLQPLGSLNDAAFLFIVGSAQQVIPRLVNALDG